MVLSYDWLLKLKETGEKGGGKEEVDSNHVFLHMAAANWVVT